MWSKLNNLRILVGSFPAHGTIDDDMLIGWMNEMEQFYAANPDIPYAVNLVTHRTNKRYESSLELVVSKKVPLVLSSKGAPGETCKRVHEYGGLVFHDVASRRHAEKALEAGVDGLIAVTDGAGGHCGTINPFGLMNEIRQITDKPIILGGSISTGQDVLAAQTMGATFAYMGTRFICTEEANTKPAWKNAIVESNTAKDILMTSALDGAPSNWIKSSLVEIYSLLDTALQQ